MRWAREWAKEGVAVDWQRLLPPKGFQVLPRRWVVERTIRLDRAAKEDEQRLREVVCERGSVDICCHDPPHDEATRPSLRTFHTASLGTWVNRGKGRPGLTVGGSRLANISLVRYLGD